jgi:hypothetical protein
MKSNSTNVFTEGLNFDLNPITTPNNVLTDCVNGTFLTFNGDELALQNDAGNTKIAVPGTNPVEYVELTEGFYPLGIKEYGGVLYIVSAKTPDTDTWEEWSDKAWAVGDIVYKTTFEDNIYYRSLEDNNVNELPTMTNTSWELLGDEKTAFNILSEVEFGSYPSPEASGRKEFPGDDKKYTSSTTLDELYKKVIINDAFFKTTRYVKFEELFGEGTRDTSNISGYSDPGVIQYNPLFYKVKLYHQMDNGYLDLTDNIWVKFNEYLLKKGLAPEDNF